MPNDKEICFFPWVDFPIEQAKKSEAKPSQRVFDVDHKLVSKKYDKARKLAVKDDA